MKTARNQWLQVANHKLRTSTANTKGKVDMVTYSQVQINYSELINEIIIEFKDRI